MSEKMTFLKLAEEVLEQVKKPLTALEIWENAEKMV
ncbi:MAG: HTH domain-containing protein [Candidatus Woesearchaeota archaeon]